jgi:hypothetical protein
MLPGLAGGKVCSEAATNLKDMISFFFALDFNP